MSEYQYYEFLAMDRALDDHEQAEVRSLSSRATITAHSFVNEYHWGDFRGNPSRLMERYYDAHLYVANWGTRRVMFRLPGDALELDVVEDYCVDEGVSAWATPGSVVLDIVCDDELGDPELADQPETLLAALVGVRAELAAGDLRPLYLAWLAAHDARQRSGDDVDRGVDDDLEPPVPPGLATLTAAQQALVDFLRLDGVLLDVASQLSPPFERITDDPDALFARIAGLPSAEKDRLLVRLVQGEASRVQATLLRRLHDAHIPSTPVEPRRTVAALMEEAEQHRAEVRRQVAVRRAEEEASREAARLAARGRRLDRLAREGDAAWSRVEAMIATRKPAEYDAAIEVLRDLRELAERDGRADTFARHLGELRRAHARKPSLIDRLGRAGL